MSAIRRTSFLGGTIAAQSRLRGAYARLSTANDQVATNRLYTRPSQNVSASSRVAMLQEQSSRLQVYGRAVEDARSRLSFADDMLGQAMSMYHRVTELGVQAGSPLSSSSVKESIRQEVVDIRKALHGLANTRYLGEPVFAGFSGDDAVTYDDGTSTWSFNGDETETIERRIGQAETVRVNVTAAEAFVSDGTSVFEMLDDLESALSSNDQDGVRTAIAQLDGFRSTLSAAQAKVGTAAQIVERAGERNSSLAIRLEEEIVNVRDVDLADAITEQSRLQVAYEAAIAVTGKAQNMSVLDWLR